MQDFIANFHFLRPWWLAALLLPAVFYWRFFRNVRGLSSWVKVCDKKLLDFLLIKGSSGQRKIVVRTAMAGIITLIIALAGPTWKKEEIPSLTPQNPLMILLEVSSEMDKRDITPSRLARAKFKINDLLESFGGQQSGMIVYSKEPFLITPITDDIKIITNLLPEINRSVMPVNGSRLDRAIDFAAKKLKDSGFGQGNIVIFAADGGQNSAQAIEAARKALVNGYPVSAAAVNSNGSKQLEAIAESGGGVYSRMTAGDGDIRRISAFMSENLNQELKQSENKRSVWLDYGYYLVFIPLLCCLYFFRKGLLVLFFLAAGTANASAGFFLNDNQEGLRAFNQGDYQAAAEYFKEPAWKGSSLYKSGNYQAALAEFGKGSGETALYNQGNALAKSGQIDEAIAKYEDVLKLNPNHEDAKFNLEYLKQQKDQQQNQQNQQQNQSQNQNQDQNQSPQQNQGQTGAQNQEQQESSSEQNSSSGQSQDLSQDQSDTEESAQPKGNPQNEATGEATDGNAGYRSESGEEDNEASRAGGGSDEAQKNYDEKTQAREQQYRNIPEDSGGLLKAFIRKEYRRNRYGE